MKVLIEATDWLWLIVTNFMSDSFDICVISLFGLDYFSVFRFFLSIPYFVIFLLKASNVVYNSRYRGQYCLCLKISISSPAQYLV